MVIEEALVTLLVPIVGANRTYPLRIPQNPAYPALAYQRISTGRYASHSGNSHLAEPRFQLTIWAQSYSSLKTLATSIVTTLQGYRGTISDVRIDRILVENESDQFDAETQIWQKFIDIVIDHSE